MGYCVDRAHFLREFGLKAITPASVAYLLKYSDGHRRKRVSMKLPGDRCKIIARVLKAGGSQDGVWHAGEVERAYSLRRLSDESLKALDPDPPKPAPVPEQFSQLADLNRLLESQIKTQNGRTRT